MGQRVHGSYPTQNFSPEVTGGHNQNWAIVQDQDGLMYFANTNGILEFDGVNWRLIKTPTGLVFSLAIDDSNTIFAGSLDDLGYLEPDSIGQLQFVSLIPYLPEGIKPRNIRNTFSTKNGVYFVGDQFVFHWSEGEMKVLAAGEHRFFRSFCWNDKLYVQQRGIGLKAVAEDSLTLIPGGEFLANRQLIFGLPLEDGSILIGSGRDGMFIYQGDKFIPFQTEGDDFLLENQMYNVTPISERTFAIVTLNGGALIMDDEGRILGLIDEARGLQEDRAYRGLVDQQGGLWLALQNGVSKVDIASPLTFFDKQQGVEGFVLAIDKINDLLVIGTSGGLFYQDADQKFNPSFVKVAGPANVWDIEAVDDVVLVAADNGVFLYQNESTQLVYQSEGIRKIYQDPQNTSIFYLGTWKGLEVVSYDKGAMTFIGKMDGVEAEVRHIFKKDNKLWLGTFHSGIHRIALAGESLIEAEQIDLYDTLHGLPSMVENMVFPYNGDKAFATHRGIYRFDEIGRRFKPDSVLGEKFANDSRAIYQFAETDEGKVWMHGAVRGKDRFETGYAFLDSDGTYQWNNIAFLGYDKLNLFEFYPDEDGITWMGGNDLLVKYNERLEKKPGKAFSAKVRRVLTGDSLIFAGNGTQSIPRFSYSQNNIRLQYAATSFDHPEKNKFQYQLKGFDDNWSDWTSETQKDYTNLPEGSYMFHIRAQNVYEEVSGEDTFAFVVLPPWYRTWWAYVGYLILTIATFQLVLHWRSRHLRIEKQKLQRIVADRTTELGEKNEQLEQQAAKLKEVDKLKSNFFANISHEFRTPLTLILSPLNDFASEKEGTISRKQFTMMHKNARRLLKLINQLLDLSKLEAGGMSLAVQEINVVPFVRGLVMSFESWAINEKKHLSVTATDKSISLYIDTDKLDQIIFNLISNALKFTKEGDEVSVEIAEEEGIVSLKVKDSGVGIPDDQLPFVFDRFYQATSTSANQDGTGIGLALTKELITLHHGTIEVVSEVGKGTEFMIRFKKGHAHFSESELIESFIEKEPNLADFETAEFSGPHEREVELEVEHSTTNVLIVEDNDDVRDYTREHLSKHYNVSEAKDGRIGLESAREQIPDLIVCDVMMPFMDGYQLTTELKQDPKTSHIPIILLTAKADGSAKIEGLKTGADDYLIKPFDGKELIARIDNLIRSREELRRKFSKEFILEPSSVSIPSMEQVFLKSVIDAIEDRISDSDLSVENLSKHLAISRIHLHRKLKALTGLSASGFVRLIRLKRAKHLLDQNSATISEISYQVGFNSTSYFAKCFKEQFGVLPSEHKS